jgi:hypothetical protein
MNSNSTQDCINHACTTEDIICLKSTFFLSTTLYGTTNGVKYRSYIIDIFFHYYIKFGCVFI